MNESTESPNVYNSLQDWYRERAPVRGARKSRNVARRSLRQINAEIKAERERLAKEGGTTAKLNALLAEQQAAQMRVQNRQADFDYIKENTKDNYRSAANNVRNDFIDIVDGFTNDIVNPVFYDGISLFARTAGQQEDPRSKYLNAQADLHDRQAARADMTAQQEAGIANRDFRVEADKDAVAQAATKNAQAIQNMSSAAGGGAAALQRQLETAQYDTHRQRQDDSRRKAQDYRDEATNIRQTAIGERSAATDLNTQKAQELEYNEQLRAATQQQQQQQQPSLLDTIKNAVVNDKNNSAIWNR